MALHSVLEQLKHGSLSKSNASDSGTKVPPTSQTVSASQKNLFTIDDDDLFDFEKDLLSGDSPLFKAQSTHTAETSSTHASAKPSCLLALSKPVVNKKSTVSAQPSSNVPNPPYSSRSVFDKPSTSSVQKLKSFQFVKTRNSSSSVLGKRDSNADSRSGLDHSDDGEIGPPLSKRSTPSVDELLSQITPDDILAMDMDDSNMEIDSDVSRTEAETLLTTMSSSQEPRLTRLNTFSNTTTNLSTSTTVLSSGHRSTATSSDSTTKGSKQPLFKTPSHRVKEYPSTASNQGANTPTKATTSGFSTPKFTPYRKITTQNSTPSSQPSFTQNHQPSISPSPSGVFTSTHNDCQITTSSSQLLSPSSTHTPPTTFNPKFTRQFSNPQTPSSSASFSTPTRQSSLPPTPSGFRTPYSRQPTPLVCTPMGNDGTPSVMRAPVSNRRKFPGPAGLLPSLVSGQCMDNLYIQPPSTPRPVSTPRVQSLAVARECSSEDDCFSTGPWVSMLQDLDMNDSRSSALLQYTIANAIEQAHCKRLPRGKVPHLRALLKSIAPAGKNASAVLKDPSGEILCTIHSKVFEDFQKELQPGAAVILRQVSLFSPAPRKHYLNITPDNIIRVYPTEPCASPQGQLDLSLVERMYNTENICPPSNKAKYASSQIAHTQSSSTRFSQPLTNRVPRSVDSIHDSLTIQRQEHSNPEPVSQQHDANLGDFQSIASFFDKPQVDKRNLDGEGTQGGNERDTSDKSTSLKRSIFDQFCEDDFDAILGDLGDDAFNL